jgi:hypothetical protein
LLNEKQENMKKVDLSDLKVGDKAWSCVFGTVIIHGINNETSYPIEVNACTFDVNGFQKYIHTHPTLFHSIEEFREYWSMQAPETLTKREQFAMAAMQGILSNPDYSKTLVEDVANQAIQQAYVMLIKLNEKP